MIVQLIILEIKLKEIKKNNKKFNIKIINNKKKIMVMEVIIKLQLNFL